jgi:hypothetical protein
LVRREIQEIPDALESVEAAIETGEVTSFKQSAMRIHTDCEIGTEIGTMRFSSPQWARQLSWRVIFAG